MKPALLVIDVQKQFYGINTVTTQSLKSAVEYINAAIDLFRGKNLPVICIQHIDPEEDLIPGKEGFDLPEDLKILPTDPHIHKTYGNSFNKTNLTEILHSLEVDTVIVTGFCAEYCVLNTIRGAKDQDFAAIILRNSLASVEPENIPFVEKINDLISYSALKQFLSKQNQSNHTDE